MSLRLAAFGRRFFVMSLGKEHDLNQTFMPLGFRPLIFRGDVYLAFFPDETSNCARKLRTGCAWNILDIVLVLAQVTEELLLALAADSDGQHNADVIWTDLWGWIRWIIWDGYDVWKNPLPENDHMPMAGKSPFLMVGDTSTQMVGFPAIVMLVNSGVHLYIPYIQRYYIELPET